MSTSHKKVIVRRFHQNWISGYLSPADFVQESGAAARIDLLDLSGRVLPVALPEVKMVSFVREFNPGDPNPERLQRKSFISRPRSDGLWLRLTFRDGDQLEGMAANDLSLLQLEGLLLTPPDTRSNTQRIYVPRSAITQLHVLAVIGGQSRRKPASLPADSQQEDLFHMAPAVPTTPN